jgi:hypothetical protein
MRSKMMYENTLVTVAIEPSENPWVKVFTKRKVKEFSQCTTAERVHKRAPKLTWKILPSRSQWTLLNIMIR